VVLRPRLERCYPVRSLPRWHTVATLRARQCPIEGIVAQCMIVRTVAHVEVKRMETNSSLSAFGAIFKNPLHFRPNTDIIGASFLITRKSTLSLDIIFLPSPQNRGQSYRGCRLTQTKRRRYMMATPAALARWSLLIRSESVAVQYVGAGQLASQNEAISALACSTTSFLVSYKTFVRFQNASSVK
jgi:hypothetical protein